MVSYWRGFSVWIVCSCLLNSAVFSQTTTTLTFQVGGKTRHVIFHVPGGADKPPVVFFIHGANGSGPAFEKETKGDALADKEKFIAVYPSASGTGSAGIWDDMSGTGNYPFFLAILDTLDARYRIDRNRVYMTGFSQGGFISFVAGCKYSSVFAAIAPVSGHAGTSCTLERPVPVFMTFGAQEGASSFLNDLNVWLKLDSCPSTPEVTDLGSGVSKVTYGPCAQGTYVVMDSISGQGHQWPNKMNWAEQVWEFFKQFSLEDATQISQQTASATRETVMASYASGTIRIQGMKDISRIRVIDSRGRQVTSSTGVQQLMNFKNRPTGIYLIRIDGNGRSCVVRKIVVP